MFPELAERLRRRDHDQGVEIVAKRPLLEQLGRPGGEAVLLELVEIGLRISAAIIGAGADRIAGARRPGAGEGAAGTVGLLLAVLGIVVDALALDLEVGELAVALVAEEQHLAPV